MSMVMIILVAAVTFGACFLLDKGYTKKFRGQEQHKTGLSVRLNKRYGVIGLLMVVLGIAGLFASFSDTWVFTAASIIIILIGICLIVYYMTFGLFYDEDSFILTTFGKKSVTYRFADIRCQQLYTSYGTVIIELQLYSGRTFQLQSGLIGVYPFLDTAFAGWCRQKGIQKEACAFHDPDNSCWFPKAEDC